MDKKAIVLAGMSTSKEKSFTPVQVQKMFFLIDKEIPHLLGGPYFNFEPYNYGPYDKGVYETIEELAEEGLVVITNNKNWKEYKLSATGQKIGEEVIGQMPEKARSYLDLISAFVRNLTFSQLVSAIYKAYPEMKANSVFQD